MQGFEKNSIFEIDELTSNAYNPNFRQIGATL